MWPSELSIYCRIPGTQCVFLTRCALVQYAAINMQAEPTLCDAWNWRLHLLLENTSGIVSDLRSEGAPSGIVFQKSLDRTTFHSWGLILNLKIPSHAEEGLFQQWEGPFQDREDLFQDQEDPFLEWELISYLGWIAKGLGWPILRDHIFWLPFCAFFGAIVRKKALSCDRHWNRHEII